MIYGIIKVPKREIQMKTQKYVCVSYQVELSTEEQMKFYDVPYGIDAKREGTEIPLLSEVRRIWGHQTYTNNMPSLSQEEYDALIEYLK